MTLFDCKGVVQRNITRSVVFKTLIGISNSDNLNMDERTYFLLNSSLCDIQWEVKERLILLFNCLALLPHGHLTTKWSYSLGQNIKSHAITITWPFQSKGRLMSLEKAVLDSNKFGCMSLGIHGFIHTNQQ